MHKRPLPEFRRLRRVDARLFHQVVRHHIAGLLDFALRCLQLKLGAVLQEFLKLLLRDGLAARLPAFVVLHPELLQKLHKLRLEIAPELHFVGGFVFLLAVGTHLHFHALGNLLQQRFHIIRVGVLFLLVVAHIHIFPILRRDFFVGYLRYDGVDAQRGFGGVFYGGFGVEHLPYDAPNLLGFLDIFLRGGQAFELLQTEPDQELHHRLAHRQFGYVGALRQRIDLNFGIGTAYAAILHLDARVQPRILDHGVYVERQFAVVEQVEEALRVGEPRLFHAFGVDFGHRLRLRGRHLLAREFVAQIVEHRRRPVELEPEAAELKVRYLMGGHHLEPVEVLHLGNVPIDQRRHKHRGAFG